MTNHIDTDNCMCDQCCHSAYLQGIAEFNYDREQQERYEATLTLAELLAYEREQREQWLLMREQAKTGYGEV